MTPTEDVIVHLVRFTTRPVRSCFRARTKRWPPAAGVARQANVSVARAGIWKPDLSPIGWGKQRETAVLVGGTRVGHRGQGPTHDEDGGCE